ncbi:MAG: PEGA domain-containing protein [Candidatus Omnitrophica bacterium]|nr:PEGA domain-containing protein [Candidatus Omnitrophota bacterium]
MTIARRLIFFIFLGLYLILCPVLILYAFGYIFNPIKQVMTQTGLIYLSSTPPGADIYLEASRYKEKTPASINELLPGNYKITLKKKNYKPWAQTVSINEGRAVSFKSILLIPKSWPVGTAIAQTFLKLTPLKGTDYFLLARASNLGSYLVYDCRRDKFAPLVLSKSVFFDLPVDSILTQKNSHTLIVHSGSLWNRKYAYINVDKSPFEVMDISKLMPKRPLDIAWSDFNRTKLFAAYKGHLNLLDIESLSLVPYYVENMKGYGVHEKWVYTLDKHNNVFRQTHEKGQKELLFENSQLGNESFSQAKIYAIDVLEDDTLLFSNHRGQLVTNVPPYNLIEKGALGFLYYKRTSQLLYWTRQAIVIVDFSQTPANLILPQIIARQNIVYDSGKDIGDCFMTNDDTHVVFNDNDKLCVLEIEPQGPNHVEVIADIQKNSSFFYSQSTGIVYYLGAHNGNLNTIDIMQRQRAIIAETFKTKTDKIKDGL